MKTWLTCDENGWVRRHCEYECNGEDCERSPEWIGCIEQSKDGERYFQMYGDNRTLTVDELQQILDFL